MDPEKQRQWALVGDTLARENPEAFDVALRNLRDAIEATRILKQYECTLLMRPKKTLRRYSA